MASRGDCKVENTYNKGIILAEEGFINYLGGIIGYVYEYQFVLNINNNYNIGQIELNATGVTDVGGAIGYIVTSDTIKASRNYYKQGTVISNGSNTSGEEKTEEYMKTLDFVTDLNTGLVDESGASITAWGILAEKNEGYPVLIGVE